MPTVELARVCLKPSSSSTSSPILTPNPTPPSPAATATTTTTTSPTPPPTTHPLPSHLLPTWRAATSLASTAAGSRFSLYGAVPRPSPAPSPTPSSTASTPSAPHARTRSSTAQRNGIAPKTQGAGSGSDLFMIGIWRDEAEHMRFLTSLEAKAMAVDVGREAEVVGVRFAALRGLGEEEGLNVLRKGGGGGLAAKEGEEGGIWWWW